MNKGWVLVGKITRNDIRGNDPISKLHKKLLEIVPTATEVAQFGMSEEALEYFEQQLVKLAEKQNFTAKATKQAVGMAMLQFAPCTIEGITGFQVYYREK